MRKDIRKKLISLNDPSQNQIPQLSGSVEGVSDLVLLKSGIGKSQESPARMFGQCVIVRFTTTNCSKEICKFILYKSSALGLGRINGPGVSDSTTHSPILIYNTKARERESCSECV